MAAKPSVTGMDLMWSAQVFCTLYTDYWRELEEEKRARHIRQAAKQARRPGLLRRLRRRRPEPDCNARISTAA
jgi:hypothetical protein